MKEISVTEQIAKRGYISEIKPYVPSNDLIFTTAHIRNLDVNRQINRINRMHIEDALADTKSFFDVFYQVHDVPYLKYIINNRFLKLANRQNVNPFSLPVIPKTVSDETFYGSLITELSNNQIPQVAFLGIELNSLVTEVTSCSYAHEITHAEVDSVNGAITSYYNSEVLSVFIELQIAELLAKAEKILRTEDSRRIYEIEVLARELKDYHQKRLVKSEDDALIDSKYVVSDVRAYNLFAEYYYGSNSTREYIKSRIQSIFDGNYTVEELLNEFMDINRLDDLNPTLSLSPKAIKYFHR